MNIKKLFATLAGVSLFAQTVVPSAGVFGATYSQELQDAYNWAYGKSITTMSPIDNANMYGAITRAELAKMLANWAKDAGKTPDTSATCTFTDTASVKGDLATAIVEACQLGLMGQGITAFRPYDTISRAEFGTALSRALWGNKYEGGNPYYANHLNALKAAGIMNQIANAESTKEVRGYVMLMLMRSEGGEGSASKADCDDEVISLACQLGTDACPAECREDAQKDEDGVVKAGSLSVSVDANANQLFIGRDSDLDSLTFKTSEEVELTKVVLEREGYSTASQIDSVWLEDENGAKIADPKPVDSKGQAKLTIKKDYRSIDGELVATIVVKTKTTPTIQPGATVGFKVVDVESTAKDVDLPSKANTYTAIDYDGSKITVTARTAEKDYNYVAGDMFEVAKFKVETPDDSSIVLKGLTLKNNGAIAAGTRVDVRKYFDNAEVTVAGKAVKGLNASVNKNDELVISFDEAEIAAKTKAEVIVKVALTEDFDTFPALIANTLTDLAAVDGKVSSRVGYTTPLPIDLTQDYTFRGSKIKLTNVKLGNIDAAQNSEDILIGEGEITVSETVKGTFYVDVKGKAAGAIKELTVVINGDETDGSALDLTKATNAPAWAAGTYQKGKIVTNGGKYYVALKDTAAVTTTTTDWEEVTIPVAATKAAPTPALLPTDFVRFEFSNVEIEKSGKVKFLVDINDFAAWDKESITFSTFNGDAFSSLSYDESNNPVDTDEEVSGSISISKVTIQPAKASLSNKTTKDVEFATQLSERKVVFDGTYTAKKGDIKLNEFSLTSTTNPNSNNITFYLYVDGDLVADAKVKGTPSGAPTSWVASDTFDNVLVEAEKSVNVKVEAEVEAKSAQTLGKYELKIRGEDVNSNPKSGEGKDKTATMKVVEKGSVEIPSTTAKQTILRKADDAKIATFEIKPANNGSEVTLEEIEFKLTSDARAAAWSSSDITLKVGGIEEDDVTVTSASTTAATFTYAMNKTVDSNGVVVEVSLDDEWAGSVSLDGLVVNDKSQSKTFSKRYVDAAVWVKTQTSNNGNTTYVLGVDKDSSDSVRNFTVYYQGTAAGAAEDTQAVLNKEFSDGDKLTINGVSDWQPKVTKVTYEYTNGRTWTAGTAAKAKATIVLDNADAVNAIVGATLTDSTSETWKITATTDNKTLTCEQVTAANRSVDASPVVDGATASGLGTTKIATIQVTSAGAAGTADKCIDVDGTTDVVATYGTQAACEWSTETILKSGAGSLPDYFEVGDNEDPLQVFKL